MMPRSSSPICGTPVSHHIAQKSRHSAIDGRITRHKGYALSLRHRKRIEEAFGWEPKPSEGPLKLPFQASSAHMPTSSWPWPQEISPHCRSCLLHEQKMTLPATRQPPAPITPQNATPLTIDLPLRTEIRP